VAVDPRGLCVYRADGPDGALEERPLIGVHDRYLHELHGGVRPVVSESRTQNPPESRRLLAHATEPARSP
jgi:hypothetical protein